MSTCTAWIIYWHYVHKPLFATYTAIVLSKKSVIEDLPLSKHFSPTALSRGTGLSTGSAWIMYWHYVHKPLFLTYTAQLLLTNSVIEHLHYIVFCRWRPKNRFWMIFAWIYAMIATTDKTACFILCIKNCKTLVLRKKYQLWVDKYKNFCYIGLRRDYLKAVILTPIW